MKSSFQYFRSTAHLLHSLASSLVACTASVESILEQAKLEHLSRQYMLTKYQIVDLQMLSLNSGTRIREIYSQNEMQISELLTVHLGLLHVHIS